MKRPEVARVATLVGEDEASALFGLLSVVGDTSLGRFRFLPLRDVRKREASPTAGLVAFLRGDAGEEVGWDVSQGRPTDGTAPLVVATGDAGTAAFARDVHHALVHVLARAVVATSGVEATRFLEEWHQELVPVLSALALARLERLVRAARRAGRATFLANLPLATRRVRDLVPR